MVGESPTLTLKSASSGAARHRSLSDPKLSMPMLLLICRVIDFLLLATSGAIAFTLVKLHWGDALSGQYVLATAIASFGSVHLIDRRDGYTRAAFARARGQIRSVVIGQLFGTACLLGCLFVTKATGEYSRIWVALWFLFGAAALIAWRVVAQHIVAKLARDGHIVERIAIVGATEFGRGLIERIRTSHDSTVEIVGLFDDRAPLAGRHFTGLHVDGRISDLLEYSRAEPIDSIVVALPLSARDRVRSICTQLKDTIADVHVMVEPFDQDFSELAISSLAGSPVMRVGARPIKDWDAVMKWLFDRVLGSLLLVALSPLLLAIAVAIRLGSPGPILFRQKRLGFNNRVFEVLKFRTMYHNNADLMGDRLTQRNDSRITKVGKFLRRLSLDELPQLINVMRGEMSIVGPRPHPLNAKAADRLYTDVVADYARRHRVLPGITGWAQVNGWRGETEAEYQIEQRVAHDLYYIDHWSVGLDFKILWMTATREILSTRAF